MEGGGDQAQGDETEHSTFRRRNLGEKSASALIEETLSVSTLINQSFQIDPCLLCLFYISFHPLF